MITSVGITNFKSLKSVALETRNLNLLTGLNGSGKSSLIQALLLLRQSPEIGQGRLLLKNPGNDLFDAGVAEDVYFQSGIEKHIRFSLTIAAHLALSWQFACDPLTDPAATILLAPEYYSDELLYRSALFSEGFQYLTAERTGPRSQYARNIEVVEGQRGLGNAGEYAVDFLYRFGSEWKVTAPAMRQPDAKSDLLIHQTEAWLSEIAPGVQVEATPVSNEEIRLSFQFSTTRGKTTPIKPKNVGFGLTYVLPVILAALTAEPDKLILIENPESHIHPRGQVELGRLLAACAQSGAQLFVETHSDHILNGLRIATKQNLIEPDKAVAFFFQRMQEDNCTDITPIVVDAKGKLHRQTPDGTTALLPKGFFDQWTSSMAKLF
jgi:predicted ATPase